jgi:hypothetical protein
MNALALFASTFVLVFALSLQTLNVVGRHYIASFLTSLLIGAGNLVLFKLAPDASSLEIGAYLLGGAFGVVALIWAYPWLARLIGKR